MYLSRLSFSLEKRLSPAVFRFDLSNMYFECEFDHYFRILMQSTVEWANKNV